MFQFFQSAGFTFEALEDDGVLGKVCVKDFHCERNVSLKVPDAVDRTHSSSGDKCVHSELLCNDLTYDVS